MFPECTTQLKYHISSNRRPGVYFLHDSGGPAFKQGRCLNAPAFISHISCPRPPTLHRARRCRNSLQFVRPYGKPREQQAHSIVIDTSKHLFCAIGVAVREVQLSPLSLPRDARRLCATTGPTRRLIEVRCLFAILPLIPPAFKRGRRLFEGGVYSRKYSTHTS